MYRPIRINPAHKGLLHKDLGVPQNKPLSMNDLESAKEDVGEGVEGEAERKRIQFAINAKGFSHHRKVGG